MMRLDKYLKVSRIIKRRTIAKQLASEGRVVIDGKVAKPSTEVFAGDILEINIEHKRIFCEITDLDPKLFNKDGMMYKLIDHDT